MPNFSYKCKDCGEVTVINVPIADRDLTDEMVCEVCQGTELKRIPDKPANIIVGGRNKGRNNSLDVT